MYIFPTAISFYLIHVISLAVLYTSTVRANDPWANVKQFFLGKNIADEILVRLYSNQLHTYEVQIKDSIELLAKTPDFNRNNPTVFVTHGMKNDDARFILPIIDAFKKSGKIQSYNVLSITFPDLVQSTLGIFFDQEIVSGSQVVGNLMHTLLKEMIDKGLTQPDNVYLIGFGVGAHICGYAARPFNYKDRIQFIAGLDPAGAGYDEVGGTAVSSSDARFVHIFQTNSYWQATAHHRGTANFIFNGGMIQPGCLSNYYGCSHDRAITLYAEAIENGYAFEARSCPIIGEFSACLCNGNSAVNITFPHNEGAKGNYYLRTNSQSPYGMGTTGSTCAIADYVWIPWSG